MTTNDPYCVEYIRKNLTELVSSTKCNTLFLTELYRNEFLQDDLDKLKGATSDNDKAVILYEILATRKRLCKKLLEALKTTSQTGAADILQHAINLKQPETNTVHQELSNNSAIEAIFEADANNVQPSDDTADLLPPSTEENEESTNIVGSKFKQRVVLLIMVVVAVVVVVVVAVLSICLLKNNPLNIPTTTTTTAVTTAVSTTTTTLATTTSTAAPDFSKYTITTILMFGPVGPQWISELISNLCGFGMSCVQYPKKRSSFLVGSNDVWRYDVVGMSNGKARQTNCDFDFRLVILDVPVLDMDAKSADFVSYLRSYIDSCKAESYCSLFQIALPVKVIYNAFKSEESSHVNDLLTEYLHSIRLFFSSSSSFLANLSSSVLLLNENNPDWFEMKYEERTLIPLLKTGVYCGYNLSFANKRKLGFLV